MLVLSRKPMQSIMIGSDIKITIVKVERNQVRIGIEAPRDLTILRDELTENVTNESKDGRQRFASVPTLSV
jgi:carbon storage regulator